jgi:hypothetical protein
MSRSGWFALLPSVSAVGVVLALSGAFGTGQEDLAGQGKTKGPGGTIAGLETTIAKLERLTEHLRQQVSWLSRTSPPLGAVVAYSGEWPPKKDGGGNWTERELGWMLCDGRALTGNEYAALRSALGKDRLPDYRGHFLRGVDRGTDGTSAGRDKDRNPETALGTEQNDTTRRPRTTPFETGTGEADDKDGHHGHGRTEADNGLKMGNLTFNRLVANGVGYGGTTRGDSDALGEGEEPFLHDSREEGPGAHSHRIGRGGDKETRPVNVAVYWIIRSSSDRP